MPILDGEPACFPDDLLEGFAEQQDERCWWVLHTKARQEKSVARALRQSAIPFFLPQIAKTSMQRNRKRTSFIPLFTGYVFLLGTELERQRSLETNRIAQVLPVRDGVELRQDLGQIWRLIQNGAPLTVESRLAPGDRVRVISGSLAGLEGVVAARRAKTRLLVAVRMLQQGVSVEIDDYFLEPIG